MNKEKIGVIGLGYVGKPLAYLAASKGYEVIGIDNCIKTIDGINKRQNIPEQLTNSNNVVIYATDDYSKLKDVDIIVVCIPTPTKDGTPDLAILEDVVKNIENNMKKGCLIILESTVAPGMTRKYIMEHLKRTKDYTLDADYNLAYCPERIDPGNRTLWVGNINRVCGGASESSLNRAIKFYSSIMNAKIIPMKTMEEAELVKVWENTMRNISIAQANLLARICDSYGFSVKDCIDGLNSKVEQFGLSISHPGIGPGGHCIPEDIHYLIQTLNDITDVDTSILEDSVAINKSMPNYVYNKLLNELKKDKLNINNVKILGLGVSYKANSNDTRCSQAIVLYNIISKDNSHMTIYDPFVCDYENKYIAEHEFHKYANEANVIVIGCAHDEFLNIDYMNFKSVKYIVDCWNKLDKNKIMEAGITYIGVGE